MFNESHSTLDIEQFYFVDHEIPSILDYIGPASITELLTSANSRAIKIRMLFDSKMARTYKPPDFLTKPIEAGVEIIDFQKIGGGIQHAKYFIVDGDEVFLGSQNFDWRSLDQIHELGVRVKDKEFAKVYQKIFEYDWRKANGEDAAFIPTGIMRHPVIHMEGKDTLILYPTASPKDYIPYEAYWDETEIVRIIDSAKQEVVLQFLTYKTDKDFSMALDSAIFRAASRNVKVKLIVSDWSIGKPAIDYLKIMSSLPNIEIRYTSIPDLTTGYIPYARVEHCKFISVDNKYCWIGTSNAEKSYFYNSRNVGIVIENPKVASRVHDIFMKSWDSEYAHPIVPDGEYTPREHGEK